MYLQDRDFRSSKDATSFYWGKKFREKKKENQCKVLFIQAQKYTFFP